MTGNTIHGSAILLGTKGVLIEGDSGSGKSTLATALLRDWSSRGYFTRWVCDDQLSIKLGRNSVTAHAVETIAGKAEQRHVGIIDVPYVASARLDLIVSLVAEEKLERMPDALYHPDFPDLPILHLPRVQTAINVALVTARLEQET